MRTPPHRAAAPWPRRRRRRAGGGALAVAALLCAGLPAAPRPAAAQIPSGPTPEQENYDARSDHRADWFRCRKTVGRVPDQSACGSDWAVAAASAMSDRACIAYGENESASAAQLLSCCNFVGGRPCGIGCNGGMPQPAWDWWVQNGIATESCYPYPWPECEHHGGMADSAAALSGDMQPCQTLPYATPPCNHSCDAKKHKLYGEKAYLVPTDQYKKELIDHGPFQVSFTLYDDLLSYKKGDPVYQHSTGKEIKTQSAKILGWGEQKGVPYWLLMNSWNEHWGDKGLFRILRGHDECGVEARGVAGLPKRRKPAE